MRAGQGDHRRVGRGAAGGLRRIPPHTGIEGQQLGPSGDRVEMLRQRVNALAENMGHRPRIVVGKPGLDGHPTAQR